MLFKPGYKKFWAAPAVHGKAAAAAFSLTYQSSVNSAATTTTVNYGTMTYGSGNTRVIICIGTFASGPVISSVTVNGVAATQVALGGTANFVAAIWQTNSAVSGSSGTVSVTYTVAPISGSVVGLYNLQTTTTAATSTAVDGTGGGTTTAATVTVPAAGGAVAFGIAYQQTPGLTNAASDATLAVGPDLFARFGHTTSTGSVTVNATAGSSTVIGLAVAAWDQ